MRPLLAQPDGIKGFGLGLEAQRGSNDLSSLKLVEVELTHVNRHTAGLPAALPVDSPDNGVSGLGHFLEVGTKLVER